MAIASSAPSWRQSSIIPLCTIPSLKSGTNQPSFSEQIYRNNGYTDVTANAFAALRRLRLKEGNVYMLWRQAPRFQAYYVADGMEGMRHAMSHGIMDGEGVDERVGRDGDGDITVGFESVSRTLPLTWKSCDSSRFV